ncbi:MAG: hypothetical protein LBT05_12335 [Planctomycetaceae bacterium]|jgi:hypothetical protein|nr:hypothetical protein [Planctomycetaceae bacterium]
MSKHDFNRLKFFIVLFLTFAGTPLLFSATPESTETLQSLAEQFEKPPLKYRPHVWWHWMGSNFTKTGITKDLEAMKEAGIGGGTIFNIASSVQNTHAPMENNPYPEQTYRSAAYWDAMRHTMSEAQRLGLVMGLHGTPGYATTGGPWITEEYCMQTLTFTKIAVQGGRTIETTLSRPELPIYRGYSNESNSFGKNVTGKQATYYKDVAVMAIPDKARPTSADVLDISANMDENGRLKWQTPAGSWTICRIGHAPTMAHPHPLPDDIIGKTLEVDKMSRAANLYHWRQLLDPLKEHIGEFFGKSFTYVWIDSYESGDQNWTPTFREDFIRLKGYDPLPYIALQQTTESGKESEELKKFQQDNRVAISRLFIDNGWKTAQETLHSYGLKLYWEPYAGPWDSHESVSIPDLPVGEFWTGGSGSIGNLPAIAREFGKPLVGAEAFTGRPETSKYTEDPAFLKHSADGGYASGANWYFLHHWVHQPFDDRYQPGMGMGWWGTHFSRHQTWLKPGKAFFTYLARCQMLLQQGVSVASERNVAHRSTPDAEIFFVINPERSTLEKAFAFPVKDRVPELWDAYAGVIRRTRRWKADGDKTSVNLKLEPDESVFVVFPKDQNCPYSQLPTPEYDVKNETAEEIRETWKVRFEPKLDAPFVREFPALTDFSESSDPAVKYFAGTAVYEQTVEIPAEEIGKNKRFVLDLGKLNDVASLKINGKDAGMLWNPPYKADATSLIRAGENRIAIEVTVNWANRLIGDEQEPADFEWGADRGDAGRAMKAFPDWFLKNQPRPSQGRKTFNIWYYYRKDSPLQPAGLLGPVRLLRQETDDPSLNSE